MNPLFSIITVTYNAADTVQRTLDSVASQSCSLYEHLVIDGASTDGTVEIVGRHASPRIKLFSEPDHGVYDGMNKGIEKATGDYLIFLNAGDKFHSPDTLQQFADAILKNDYPGIVYGQTDIVDKDGRYLGPRHLVAPEKLDLKSFRQGMVVCHQAMAVLRQIAPLYNMKYRYSSDYEWCVICLMHSRRNVYIGGTVCDYLSQGQTTAHHKQSLRERYRIMCTYYGTLPTLWRHIRFGWRYLRRRKSAPNCQ